MTLLANLFFNNKHTTFRFFRRLFKNLKNPFKKDRLVKKACNEWFATKWGKNILIETLELASKEEGKTELLMMMLKCNCKKTTSLYSQIECCCCWCCCCFCCSFWCCCCCWCCCCSICMAIRQVSLFFTLFMRRYMKQCLQAVTHESNHYAMLSHSNLRRMK